jgi:hypothetical protein
MLIDKLITFIFQLMVNAVYAKYPADPDGRLKKPRCHPVSQLMGSEWVAAGKEGRAPNWANFSMPIVSASCQQQAERWPDWHPDLTAEDISTYLQEVPPKLLWWRQLPPPTAPGVEDGAFYSTGYSGTRVLTYHSCYE